ncbi:NucA/NucB deoxyribonuclease domain-containing protein [Actinomadura kijaniata]|uniref:NucA/NucB deoxyribonuclease domain-containing protein n=1 Tax=Actinomadura kijaniata TaxID=46161 RepID=UPI003F1D6A64
MMLSRRVMALAAAGAATMSLALTPTAHAAPVKKPAPTSQSALVPGPSSGPGDAERRARELEQAAQPGVPKQHLSPPTGTPLPEVKPKETCDEALKKLQASKGRYQYGTCFEQSSMPQTRGLEPAPWPGVPSWCNKRGQTERYHRQDACTLPLPWDFRIFDTRGTIIGTGVVEILSLETAWARALTTARTLHVRVLSAVGATKVGTLNAWTNCYGTYCKITKAPTDTPVPFTEGSSAKGTWEASTDPLPGQAFWTYWVGGLEFRGPPGVEVRPATLDLPYSSRIRCDRGATGESTVGCVFPDYWPTFEQQLWRSDPETGVSEAAKHIQDAQNKTVNHWGRQADGKPLVRTQSDSIRNANRNAACPSSRPPGPAGTSCDEYPFASTYQGAAYEGKGDNSVRDINEHHNSNSGNELGMMYGAFRVLDRDHFWVKITP